MKALGRLKKATRGRRRVERYDQDWYWLDQSEVGDGLDITSLVSPLRYDVVIREDLVSLYLAHQDSYCSDFDAFFELALEHPYFVCFQFMNPDLAADETALKASYVDGVKYFVDLYQQIAESGFDTAMPIVPKTGERILPTREGKRVSGRFFMGDGCHRLACLMALGYETLPPAYVRVKRFRALTPRDGTVQLVHTVPIDPGDYFAFLSSRYAAPRRFERGQDLIEYVGTEKPLMLDELLSVIRADGMMTQDEISVLQVGSGYV